MRDRWSPARFTGPGRIGRLPDADIIRLYEALKSADAVAVKARCSTPTVLTILHRHGVAVPPPCNRGGRKELAIPVAELIRLYVSGTSLWDLAPVAGCSPSTVRNRLKEHKIPLRPNCVRSRHAARAKADPKPTRPPD